MNSEERARLGELLARMSKSAHHQIDLEGLIADWRRFVTELQTGYGASIYDYTNDVSVRDLLGELIASLSPTGADELEREIAAADDAYRAATRPSDRPLLPLAPDVHSWWWFRIPLRPGRELEADLVSEGFGGTNHPGAADELPP